MTQFCDVISQCNLVDLGFEGPQFTWTNKQNYPFTIHERLDRFLATFTWKSLYQEAHVSHHDFLGSDHRMILIDISPQILPIGINPAMSRLFRFESL